MDTTKIIDTINNYQKKGVEPFTEVVVPSHNFSRSDAYQKFIIPNVNLDTSELVEVLKDESELKNFNGGHIRTSAKGGELTDLDSLARWLLQESISDSDPRKVVLELEEFCQNNERTAIFIYMLIGIKPHVSIQLTNNIILLPIVNDSKKAGYIHLKDYPQYTYSKFGDMRLPTAGIVFDYKLNPVLLSEYNDDDDYIDRDLKLVTKGDEVIKDIIRCLTLVGPCSPQVLETFYGYRQRTPLSNPNVHLTSSQPWSEFQQIPVEPRCGIFELSTAKEIVDKYLALPTEYRENLRIPLERLNNAVKRLATCDRAIELGIAYESLLGKDKDPDPEISITSALRENGTLLHGGSEEKRKEVSDLIRDIYSIRSKAVHKGKLHRQMKFGNIGTVDTEARLWDGMVLCSILINKTINAWSVSGLKGVTKEIKEKKKAITKTDKKKKKVRRKNDSR